MYQESASSNKQQSSINNIEHRGTVPQSLAQGCERLKAMNDLRGRVTTTMAMNLRGMALDYGNYVRKREQ